MDRNSKGVILHEKFKPLFESTCRYILITGGRGSAKSFSNSTALCLQSYEQGNRALVTRWTMSSAKLSIIPEFNEKIELLGRSADFNVNETDIVNNRTGSDILFRGIKTSSGIQTAALKSIQGITTWVIEEAEELTDENTFNKIDASIRQAGKQNRIIPIMNPTTREHWIWKRWFENSYRIEMVDGYPVAMSTHPDVCHIHVTYLDNLENLSESFLNMIAQMKINDPHRYATEMIGGWKIDLDGTLFKRGELKRFAMKELKLFEVDGKGQKQELYESVFGYADIADEGTDAFAMPIGYLFPGKVFITDIMFSTDNTDITIPGFIAKFKKHNLNYARVESNNQGSMFIKAVRKELPINKVLPIHSKAKKHTRIILSHTFIKDYFYFLNQDEIIPGSEYDLFMRQLFDYMRKEGETKDKDDAPDALSGLAKMCESFLPHLFK